MGKTLTEIAKDLRTANKKVQLIYAFNGTGKTRLSREFKQLIAPRADDNGGDDEADLSELTGKKILYYNAFTEDLFYWDNDLEQDADPKLKIQPNLFTDWVLKDQGQDRNIITKFQHYANEKLTPQFSEDFSEVSFSLESGDDEPSDKLKISKGEESSFIWSIFSTLLDQVIGTLNVAEPSERETNQFDHLEYIFIDDPVSSLDENHLIELAVNLAGLIKSSQSTSLKFIVTTHSPLFYNVLFNELNGKVCYMLERLEDGTFALTEKKGDSNTSFSYHLYLKRTIEQAILESQIQKYHFTLLRNLYEKTASFLGYPKWSELLPDDKQAYLNRIIQFTSHSTLSNEAIAEPTNPEKQTVKFLLNHLKTTYRFWQEEP
jgi:hypothetical protein